MKKFSNIRAAVRYREIRSDRWRPEAAVRVPPPARAPRERRVICPQLKARYTNKFDSVGNSNEHQRSYNINKHARELTDRLSLKAICRSESVNPGGRVVWLMDVERKPWCVPRVRIHEWSVYEISAVREGIVELSGRRVAELRSRADGSHANRRSDPPL
ncbi:hypothetical protein EVAR_81182_1 [Eumeta japonica]|uniref:Uncharacterized protein n=1 Tax=Eumeta variegata TaxID=151549 RepID=A0A4C1UL56_EUMVA|nr:hypothetical protein EVAR_81182_1 [Eumeta japonica]